MIFKANLQLPSFLCSFPTNSYDIEVYKNIEVKSGERSEWEATRILLSLRQQIYWQNLPDVTT